jgi:two-component system cell cycle sensor histidine kinase/response regulator CckA
MTDSNRSAGGFVKALDKFAFRVIIYFSIVLLVGFIAFIAELIVEPHSHALLKHAMAQGFVTGLTVIAGLCLVEFFLYWSRRYTRQLEAERRKADTMLTTIVQSISDLVYVKDVEGRHLMVNKAVEEFTGQNAEQLLGKSMKDLLPPDLAAPCMQSDREPIITGKPCRIEERFSNAGGSRTLDTIKTPLRDDRGAIIGIVGISRDITEKLKAEEERRLLQAQLLQAQKMEALGHLAGGIAHDFNNILTAIIGFTEILQMELAKDDSLVHQTDQILGASQRAKKLIKGLFAFSSNQEIDMKPIDLNGIISGGRRLLQQMINERVTVRMNCCAFPLTIMGDRFQLERVLMNLATNAQDAMPDGGDLVFSTDSFEMGDDFIKKHGYGVPGSYAHLAVSDTGKGISEEHMRKIFEPLFTTKEEGKGTGLGLAIVYGIVKQHNGFVNVSSGPGRGATFHVYLPLQ